MWRAEDIFFGALRRREPRRRADHARPSRSPSSLDRRPARACPRARSCTAPRTGSRSARSTRGGTVVISPDRHFDPARLWELIDREQVDVPRDRRRRVRPPARRGARHASTPTLDLSSLTVVLSGGAILSPTVKRAWVERLPGHDPHRRLRLVGDRRPGPERHRGRRRRSRAAPRFRVNDETTVLDDDLRAGRRSASSASSPAAGTSRSGTTRTRRRPRRRSRSSTACAGRCPATTPASRTTARSPCSGGARCRSTPAARRCTPKRSRRR